MKLNCLVIAILALATAACSTGRGDRTPSSAGIEFMGSTTHVGNSKAFRIRDRDNGVVCYGTAASGDSASASGGQFQCFTPKDISAPAGSSASASPNPAPAKL